MLHAAAASTSSRTVVMIVDRSRTRSDDVSTTSAISLPLDLAEATLEESALGIVRDKRERPTVALCRLRARTEAPEQIGARRVQQVIVVERARGGEGVDQRDGRPRAIHHRDRRRTIQRHDGGRLHAVEEIVETDDPWPVRVFSARCLTVRGGDRCLNGEGTGAAAERLLDERHGLGDLVAIPSTAVLLLEQHEIAGLVETRLAP